MFEQTGAIAIDMETAGIVDTAEDNSLPVFVSRVIADPANLPIPDAILRHVDEFGDASIKGMAIELVKSPALLPTMLRLISSSRRAGKSMRMIAGELQGMS